MAFAKRDEVDFFSEDSIHALSTLVYSENLELQRSAALAFAEITEKSIQPVDTDILDPILFLLRSFDVEVQRAAGAALGNLAVNDANKKLIVAMNGLEPLKKQMMSPNVEVQCNAVGCITNLATDEDNKAKIASSGALVPLTNMAMSKDMRVQRNATGALLNMTHSDENRRELVQVGAVPVMVSLLSSTDPDVQYYCTTALSNIAVDEDNRIELAKKEPRLVAHLINLMGYSSSPRVQCQAALALRNLASDDNYQLEIVRYDGLPHLLQLLNAPQLPLVLAAAACIRNVSIHSSNVQAIVEAGFMEPLVDLLGRMGSEEEGEVEILCHVISTLRNLAAPSDKNKVDIINAGVVQKCKDILASIDSPHDSGNLVQSEMTAFLAVLALSDELKPTLFKLGIVDVLIPLTRLDTLSAHTLEIQGNSAAALGNLSSKIPSYDPFVNSWKQPSGGIQGFLVQFLTSTEPTFAHISAWMILQLVESGDERIKKLIAESPEIMASLQKLDAENQASYLAKVKTRTLNNEDPHMVVSRRAVPELASRILSLLT